VCGQGHLFRRWFSMVERCPLCNLRFERIEGHLSGALGVNTVVSIVVVFWVGLVGFVATAPVYPVVPLTATVTGVALFFPIFFYPFSKTVWTAIDLRMRPPASGEVAMGYGDWIRSSGSARE
jgi:Protein of unknown function (DUF983)